MFLQIQFESEIPIYQQIKNQVIRGIAIGELQLGEDLPSVRQLASDIGINFHTVNKVYNQLKQEGWVVIHRKSGVMINPDLNVGKTQEYIESLDDLLKITTAEAFLRGLSKEEFIALIDKNYDSYNSKGGK
ncbi:GntR family transcriptional regulator [Alkaliphilus peptidifermentans]|uniref:Transcriptional regulator, GntR family n=1 Tax=Alkaliphilus peptidifermentans DSM 18978 TaxID=1120976 RepID=A0A1G5CCS2_9FIRM|nr:GntR family transcriptional regulator [Alkaliphilus peptidifermentans]SCY00141.1 transcriptional regulator, GntR family [Alkaliphilus peptidifermentans DSM 18978]